jgi:hypothetical protein
MGNKTKQNTSNKQANKQTKINQVKVFINQAK